MYWITTVTKENRKKIECYVKQTCDNRHHASNHGVMIPCNDFLLRGTDELYIGEQIQVDISTIKEHVKMSEELPDKIPLLITVADNTVYNLYGGFVLIPGYKSRLNDFLKGACD
jgi:hypothetical protein